MLRAFDGRVNDGLVNDGLVKRHVITLTALFLAAVSMAPLRCATLERLTMDDMIAKSSAIVRGRVTESWAAFTGSVIYTHYGSRLGESYKVSGQNRCEIVVTV